MILWKVQLLLILQAMVYPIYAEWNFPPLSIGTVHFCFKGCWVVAFTFVQI